MRRSLSIALLLVFAALVVVLVALRPEPPLEFLAYENLAPHVVHRTPDGRAIPGVAYPNVANKIVRSEKTDDAFVWDFGQPFTFEGVQIPCPATVRFGFRTLPTKAGAGRTVRVQWRAKLTAGATAEGVTDVHLALEPGQVWFDVEVPLDADGTAHEVALTFVPPPDAASPRLALLRPHARYASTLDRPEHTPRQVILVTLDTFRADHLGCYGNTQVRTEHLDRLAAESVVFEDAYSVTNITNPSHTSIFTSLALKDHGVRDNFTRLDPACPTMIEAFRERGFRTAAFVSAWNFQKERSDFADRFDDFYSCERYHERRAEDVNGDVFEWLATHHDEDFFVWIHYFDVHMPYAPPWPYDRLYTATGPERIDKPLDTKGDQTMWDVSPDVHHYVNGYLGEIAYLDDRFGELVEGLQQMGIYDRATMVVTADHGEGLGERGIYFEHVGLFDETTRVPLIVRVPGGRVTGRVGGLVSTLDVYPTLFDVLGFDVEHAIRGHSLRPAMEQAGPVAADRVFAEHARGAQVSLRSDRWLCLLGLEDEAYFPRFSIEAGALELYDRSTGAREDIGAQHPEVLEQLRSQIVDWMQERQSFEGVPIVDEEYRRKLEALGYTR